MNSKLIDKRVLKRNLVNGLISKEEYNKYLESLPDMADNAEPVIERLFGDSQSENDEDETSEAIS